MPSAWVVSLPWEVTIPTTITATGKMRYSCIHPEGYCCNAMKERLQIQKYQ